MLKIQVSLGDLEKWRKQLGSAQGCRIGVGKGVSKPAPSKTEGAAPDCRLLEFGVFGFGLGEDGDVGVCVFP